MWVVESISNKLNYRFSALILSAIVPYLLLPNLFPSLFVCRKLHQQFESYKEQVKKMGEETTPAQDQKSEAPTCGICHKTKFADGCGHLCSYCQTKFCARCGGRVSLRSNKVTPACTIGALHTHTHTHTHKADVLPRADFSPRCHNPVIELTVSSPLITSVFKFCSL